MIPAFLGTSTISKSTFSKVKSQPPSVTADPYWANVVLLIQEDGANGGTTFTDSKNGRTITRNGTPTHSTASFPWGTSSILFDGSEDWLSLANNTDWSFGTDNFTIEFWFNPTSVSGEKFLFGQLTSDGYAPVRIDYTGSAITARIYGPLSWGSGVQKTLTVTTGTWYHVAVVRNGTLFSIYVNGEAGASTGTSSGSINVVTDTLKIGGASGNPGGITDAAAYMKGIRVTKGVARYTANFTPPTGPFPTV